LASALPRFGLSRAGVRQTAGGTAHFSRTPIARILVACWLRCMREGKCRQARQGKIDFGFLCSLSHRRGESSRQPPAAHKATTAQNWKPPRFQLQFPLCSPPFEPHLHSFIPRGQRLAPPNAWLGCLLKRRSCRAQDHSTAAGMRVVASLCVFFGLFTMYRDGWQTGMKSSRSLPVPDPNSVANCVAHPTALKRVPAHERTTGAPLGMVWHCKIHRSGLHSQRNRRD
jgi:hypothetical protein